MDAVTAQPLLVSAWRDNEHHAGSLAHNYGFFTGFMDILCRMRLTPSDKIEARPGYRCTACRGAPAAAG